MPRHSGLPGHQSASTSSDGAADALGIDQGDLGRAAEHALHPRRHQRAADSAKRRSEKRTDGPAIWSVISRRRTLAR